MPKCRTFRLICAAGLVLIGTIGRQVRADSVGSATAAGKNTLSETLSYDGISKHNKDTGNGLNWNLSAGVYRVKTITPITKREIVDKTTSYAGGLGWDQSNWELGADLNYSRTPEEDLRAYGPDAYLGFTFQPKSGNASVPSLKLKGTYAGQRYIASFHNKLPELSITQSAASLEAALTPTKWASLSTTYSAYSYNRDIRRIAKFLDSTLAIRIGLSRMSSTVFGFPSHLTETVLTLGPFGKWTLELDSSYMISAVDSSITHATRLLVSRDVGNWNLGAGVEHDSIPVTGSQNLGLLNIYYNF